MEERFYAGLANSAAAQLCPTADTGLATLNSTLHVAECEVEQATSRLRFAVDRILNDGDCLNGASGAAALPPTGNSLPEALNRAHRLVDLIVGLQQQISRLAAV